MARRSKLKTGFTLGGEAAEADHFLEGAFFESGAYEIARSREDRRCFVVGRTGAGKSAVLMRVLEDEATHVIRINPEDLSLPYITEMQAIRHLDSIGVNLDLIWMALWKHVFLIEIIRHRYNVDSPETKHRFMQGLRDKLARDHGKAAALQYLDEFEGKFWCETEERVREITDSFTRKLDAAVAASVGVPGLSAGGSLGEAVEHTRTVRIEEADKFQRIVNDTQLGKLNTMIGVLNDYVLDDQHFTYIVIDDLDRNWVDERIANDLIRCLFTTVLDMTRVSNLKIIVALRTNIFQELDFHRRGGGQLEKLRSLIISMRWTKRELESVLDQRARLAGERQHMEISSFKDLLPNPNKTRRPLDHIFERTLLRPRDAIAFANECLTLSAGRARITWDDIQRAEHPYSTNRLLALRDEWNATYPGIEAAFRCFEGAGMRMSRDEYEARIDSIMLLLSDPQFPGTRWLTEMSSTMWVPSNSAGWFELYSPLTRVLFEVGLIGAAARSGATPVFYTDDPHFVDSSSNLSEGSYYFVHRTYHYALDVRQGESPLDHN